MLEAAPRITHRLPTLATRSRLSAVLLTVNTKHPGTGDDIEEHTFGKWNAIEACRNTFPLALPVRTVCVAHLV